MQRKAMVRLNLYKVTLARWEVEGEEGSYEEAGSTIKGCSGVGVVSRRIKGWARWVVVYVWNPPASGSS